MIVVEHEYLLSFREYFADAFSRNLNPVCEDEKTLKR